MAEEAEQRAEDNDATVPSGENQQTTDPEETPVEILAKEMGWQPKDNFKGDGDNYVDAEQYIRKGQDIQDNMRKSLKDQKQQLSDLAGSLKELQSHNERVYKAEVTQLKKELSDLTQQKKEAIQDGNVEKVGEIDEQIDSVKESMVPPAKTDTSAKVGGDFEVWVKDNKWYESDKEMSAYADSLADKHEGAPFARVAALVTKQVKEMFPDKFPSSAKRQEVSTAPRVEAGTRKAMTTKFTKSDLTDSQKSIMQQFVKQEIMSEKQYIEDIATISAGGAA